MKTYLIDSDILIDFFKKKLEAVNLIEEVGHLGNTAISVISVAELRSGWSKEDASIYLPHLYNIFEVIPLTKDIAELAGKYREEFSKKGIRLATIDTLIASTVILNEYCLATRNIKDYPIPELNLYENIYGLQIMILADLQKALVKKFPTENIATKDNMMIVKDATTQQSKIIPEELNNIIGSVGNVYRLRKGQLAWTFEENTNKLIITINE